MAMLCVVVVFLCFDFSTLFFVVWSWFHLLGMLYLLSFVLLFLFMFFVAMSWFCFLGVEKEMEEANRENGGYSS